MARKRKETALVPPVLNDGLRIEWLPVGALVPYARNARTHSDAQVAQIAASIREFGWTNPVLVDVSRGIIAGHGRLLAARKLGLERVPVIELAHLTDEQRRAYIIADNRLAELAGWDDELLALELRELDAAGYDISLTGFGDFDLTVDAAVGGGAGSLSERFMLPPFSVLNAREGWWQDRKRAWLSLGIRSEIGRGDASPGGSPRPAADYGTKQRGDGAGRAGKRHGVLFQNQARLSAIQASKNSAGLLFGATKNYDGAARQISGTSIFDPVLCEVAYRWFCPPDGVVLDPFAGGSVRGIVAARLGRHYVGCELRPEQVAANREQYAEIGAAGDGSAEWIVGDSRRIDTLCDDTHADMVFSCPPYADLEVYSDDPADLSNMPYAKFVEAYCEIIAKACGRLKNDRFACFVVGEVRGKSGGYINFVADTVAAFRAAGLEYYNEAILVTAVGSLSIRAGKGFSVSRKLGKTHQNVLVFVKGDPRRAADACGPVEVDEGLLESFASDEP